MSNINPVVRPHFDSLPADLQSEILSRNTELNTMSDLMTILEQIIAQG